MTKINETTIASPHEARREEIGQLIISVGKANKIAASLRLAEFSLRASTNSLLTGGHACFRRHAR